MSKMKVRNFRSVSRSVGRDISGVISSMRASLASLRLQKKIFKKSELHRAAGTLLKKKKIGWSFARLHST